MRTALRAAVVATAAFMAAIESRPNRFCTRRVSGSSRFASQYRGREGVRAKPDAERVSELFRRTLQRPPADKDREFTDAFLSRYRKALDGKPDADITASKALARVLLASNEFLFVE